MATHDVRVQTRTHTIVIYSGTVLCWVLTAIFFKRLAPHISGGAFKLTFLAETLIGIYFVPIYLLPNRRVEIDERGIDAGAVTLRWEEIKKIGLIPKYFGHQVRIKSSKGTVRYFWRLKDSEQRDAFVQALHENSPPNWWIDHIGDEEE